MELMLFWIGCAVGLPLVFVGYKLGQILEVLARLEHDR